MEIIYKNIKDLIPYENNPRINNKAIKNVAESIKQFGFKVPLVIDKNNVIVTGHTRYKASQKLGIKELPCIIADDLTEEQVKAFRLADNKVGEIAEWDWEILDQEIDDILEINMEDFGFEMLDEELEHQKNQIQTQKRVENILNLEQAQYEGDGKYDIPVLEPTLEVDEIKEWIGFNYVLSDKNPEGKAVHFFIDDYQFERIWNNPSKYVEKLKQYVAVTTPDFSPYGDMPLATQIFNHYRKHWVGKYLQENGVKIIPTIRASTDERSLEFYLEGEPKNGIVIISSMWTNTKEKEEIFKKEYNIMYETLKPKKVYLYGSMVEGLPGNIEVITPFSQMRFGGNDNGEEQ